MNTVGTCNRRTICEGEEVDLLESKSVVRVWFWFTGLLHRPFGRREEGMSCPQLGDPPVHPPPHRDTGYADTVAIMAVDNATPGPSAQTITYS